jgi:hypothetical protein
VTLECAWDDDVTLTPFSTTRVENAFARSIDWLSAKEDIAVLLASSGL